MTASERIREARKNGAQEQRVEAFAWKFIEASNEAEPTDENLRRVFAPCHPAPRVAELYPEIRDRITQLRSKHYAYAVGNTFTVRERGTNRVVETHGSYDEALARAIILNGKPVPSKLRARIAVIVQRRILHSLTPNINGTAYSGQQIAYAKGRVFKQFQALGL